MLVLAEAELSIHRHREQLASPEVTVGHQKKILFTVHVGIEFACGDFSLYRGVSHGTMLLPTLSQKSGMSFSNVCLVYNKAASNPEDSHQTSTKHGKQKWSLLGVAHPSHSTLSKACFITEVYNVPSFHTVEGSFVKLRRFSEEI